MKTQRVIKSDYDRVMSDDELEEYNEQKGQPKEVKSSRIRLITVSFQRLYDVMQSVNQIIICNDVYNMGILSS